MPVERIDSCHSIWLIDTDQNRYARLPAGAKADLLSVEGHWQPCFGVDVEDGDAYVLSLNEHRSRLLRFWRHTEPCPHCSNDRTEELALETTRRAGA